MATFTQEGNTVIDVFGGCGGLAVICKEMGRHCLCIDYDVEVFEAHLQEFLPSPSLGMEEDRAIETEKDDQIEDESSDSEKYAP